MAGLGCATGGSTPAFKSSTPAKPRGSRFTRGPVRQTPCLSDPRVYQRDEQPRDE